MEKANFGEQAVGIVGVAGVGTAGMAVKGVGLLVRGGRRWERGKF